MIYLIFLGVVLFFMSVRQVNQYERGIRFTLGKFTGLADPGLTLILPIVQTMRKMDIRVKTLDLPLQDTITRDNVTAKINAVIFFQVLDAGKAFLTVEDYMYSILQLAQTTMRNVTGEFTLDELLSKRDEASERIKEIIDKQTEPWGVQVMNVDLKDIVLPENLQRTIGKQAEAEREKRAVIINSEGEVAAAENLAKAAGILAATPGALHLRTLNTINDVSSDESNTILFALPIEVLRAFENWSKK
jgi:regulator of protease activity HflC (stomatin/prohibitin superfamily)